MTYESRGADDGRGAPGDPALVPGAFLVAYVAAARRVDLEPFRHLRQAGLPTRELGSAQVPRTRFLELIGEAERVARRPDFVLLLARELSLASLGPVGMLAGAQGTVREALDVLCRYPVDPPRRMRAALTTHAGESQVRFAYRGVALPREPRGAELALGLALRVLQGLIGEDWRPRLTSLAVPAPADDAPYRAFFGAVAFDQAFDAIHLDAAELARPLASADAELARLASHYLAQIEPVAPARFKDEVKELIAALTPRGECTVDQVAERLGIDRRTVHRRLAETGDTFTDLAQAARREAVEAGLAAGASPAALAPALGFSSVSAFSRWFRQTYGVAPTRYRSG